MTNPSITAGAYVAVIRRTADQLGAPLPSGVDDGLTAARALREETERIEGSAEAVNARIVELLRDGKEWQTDKELQALMFERVAAANGIRAAGIDAAEQMIRQTIADNADAIVATWASAITPDITALALAAQQITVEDLAAADVPTLSRRGLVTVWAEARTAVERLQTALQGWEMLAEAIRLPRNRIHTTLTLAANPDPAIVSRDVDVWQLARSGAKLSLATPAEYLQRVSAHDERLQLLRREAMTDQTPKARSARSARAAS